MMAEARLPGQADYLRLVSGPALAKCMHRDDPCHAHHCLPEDHSSSRWACAVRSPLHSLQPRFAASQARSCRAALPGVRAPRLHADLALRHCPRTLNVSLPRGVGLHSPNMAPPQAVRLRPRAAAGACWQCSHLQPLHPHHAVGWQPPCGSPLSGDEPLVRRPQHQRPWTTHVFAQYQTPLPAAQGHVLLCMPRRARACRTARF